MADLADHAHAHAVAILGPGTAAGEVAAEALRRGGRSRSTVLGYARHGALSRLEEATPPDLDGPAPEDLGELAAILAASRPPLERAVADLGTRHDLDRARFARAIGLPAATAAARATAVSTDWQRDLDPVLLAYLGAGGCDELAEILGAEGAEAATSLCSLLEAGPAVAVHAAGCPACRDRLRSMVSVKTLVAQRPLETAPESVRAAGAHSRLFRFPARPAPPPMLDPGPAPESSGRGPSWRHNPTWAGATILAIGLVGAVLAIMAFVQRQDGPSARVEALIKVPSSGSVLQVEPASVEGPLPPEISLRNTAPSAVGWAAEPDVEWLNVKPARGQLGAGATTPLHMTLGAAPEGDVHASVRISSADGSATVVRVATTVEHPPDLAVTIKGCEVTAAVEDEGEVGSVTLHWSTPGASTGGSGALGGGESAYSGRLPAATESLTWWVTALDARGNEARSADSTLAPGSCH